MATTANDIIVAVKNKFVLSSLQNDEVLLNKLYFAIETNIDSGLKKLAAMVSESERYIALQKLVNEVLVSATAGKANNTAMSNTDILLDSVRERGFVLVGGKRAMPVWSYEELDYPVTDTTISRFFIAGNSIYIVTSSANAPGGSANVTVQVMGNYIPTIANVPDAFVPDLIDIITQSVANSPDAAALGLKLKEDRKDS
jgi:hypothetical protein